MPSTAGRPSRSITRPRSRVMRKDVPSSALAAVAPRKGPYERHLALQPLAARFNLALRRRLVQAALAARLPFEVLHRVGDVEPGAVEPRFGQGGVEDAPRRPDEDVAFAVLGIARLLAHQHDPRARIALPEDGLRGVLPERAVAARPRLAAEPLQLQVVGNAALFHGHW